MDWKPSPREWAFSFAAFAAAMAVNYLTGTHLDRVVPGLPPARDLMFEIIPFVNLPFVHTWGIVAFFAVFGLGTLRHEPLARWPYFLWTFSLLIAVRAVFTTLTPLGLPARAPTFHDYPLRWLFSWTDFRHTLFFSGHTSLPFLGFLLSRRPAVKYASLGFSMLLAASVLLSRLHYSIDVGAAFFIAYGVYRLSLPAYAKAMSLLGARTVTGAGATDPAMSAAVLVSSLLLASPALAFEGAYHREATKNALPGFEAQAVEQIVAGNLATDEGRYEIRPEPHFDSARFTKGARFLQLQLANSLEHLGRCEARAARTALGHAFHPVQDFFSHSNWIEKNLDEPSARIDLFAVKDEKQRPISKECCADMRRPECADLPLTSGYWVIHDLRHRYCTHKELNKDSSSRKYHAQALRAAEAHSAGLLETYVARAVDCYGPDRAGRLIELLSDSGKDPEPGLCGAASAAACAAEDSLPPAGERERAVEKILAGLRGRGGTTGP